MEGQTVDNGHVQFPEQQDKLRMVESFSQSPTKNPGTSVTARKGGIVLKGFQP
jgi:hypothetical protein